MTFLLGDFKLDLVFFVFVIVLMVYLYFQWSFQYWKKRNVPYLEPSIPFGSWVPPYKQITCDSLADQYKIVKARGWKYCGMYFFGKPDLFIADLELLKHILAKDFNHFVDRGMYVNEEHENLTGHLFALGGSKWRRMRKELTPTFTTGKIKQMFQIMSDCSILLEKFTEEAAEKQLPVDIRVVLACFTTDVIGSCAFGLECNSFKDKDHPFVKYGRKVIELNMITAFKRSFANNYQSLAKFLNLNTVPTDCYKFYNDIVKQTVAYRKKNNVRRDDFLQMLIDIKNNKGEESKFTLDEVIAQSFVFLIAGFETSSTTMTYALFELAQHPEIQDKVREEVYRISKKYDNKITYDALKEMTYLGQVVDETLRMYPPLGFLTRECTLDYKLPDTDFVVEKGTTVVISIKGIHYDEEYYENPHVFDPDRFIEEIKKNRNQYQYMPFGEGPRICIGMRFGITQSKMGLATILKNHKFSVNAKTKLPFKMTVSSPVVPVPEGGIWLNIEKY